MGISRYTLYKYVKVDGTWRYCKAAYHDNGKIKPDIVFVNVKQGLLEKHPEGRYSLLDRRRHRCTRGAAEAQAATGARRIQGAQRESFWAKRGRFARQPGQDHAGSGSRKIL